EAYYIYHSPLVERQPGLSGKGYVEFGNVKKFDDMVAARLLDHIREIQSLPAYDEELQRKKEEKARKIQSLTESIAQIPIQQATIAAQLGKTTNESVITVLLAQIERLDIEQKKLIKIKEELETENGVSLRALNEELRDLETHWDTYPMAKRVALINFLIEKVVVDIMSLHWLRIRVHWLHEEWGVEQVYYCRDNYGTYRWKPQEDEILRTHYPATERLALMRLLPTRSWEAIRHRAVVLDVKRPLAWEKRGNQKMTYEDIVFMEQEGLTEDVKVTNWTSVSQPGAKVICS
ncbi:MAG TPA: hypothetical protein VFN35_01255, partial [Ktedonobacteraceae bacterium]|nr:hypothetical protein [Ktedonobacteraceae bacterium]